MIRRILFRGETMAKIERRLQLKGRGASRPQRGHYASAVNPRNAEDDPCERAERGRPARSALFSRYRQGDPVQPHRSDFRRAGRVFGRNIPVYCIFQRRASPGAKTGR